MTLFPAKEHGHGFVSVVQCAHFDEIETLVEAHGTWIWGKKVDLSSDRNALFIGA